MQLTIALAAEEAAGVQALRLLTNRGHRVATVFTGAGASGASASVASAAESLDLPVRPAAEVRDPATVRLLVREGVDLLLSVHSRHLIHADLLTAPAHGAYNLHPGALPHCAGLNTPSWALYEGAERHGVTLHQMTPVFDAGPIVFVEEFDIQPSDTGLSILMQCVRRGLALVGRLLELLEAGEPVPARPQDLDRRRWHDAGPPDGGQLDWCAPAQRVVDFVRACDFGPFPSPWGYPRCRAGELDVAVSKAAVADETLDRAPGTVAHAGGAALVAAADAWVRVEEVEVEGERLAAVEVLREGERLALLDHERSVGVAS
jgi:UDP-4-amino-4-deoxy-L-arabinose formyltransferase/UDP-glucuronic acid dehydrogenase (UDP-4-keto-hexauronic acid decarboxylating)